MMPGFTPPHTSWQCPDADASEGRRLGFLNEAVEQGQAWNESQRGYSDWRKSLDIISGRQEPRDALNYRSQIAGHRLKTNIRTSISGLSNIRPIWGFHAARQYATNANMMNKTTRALYLEGFWDQSVKEALAYAAAVCTGYIRPVYRRDQGGMGEGNIFLDTYGQPSVLPVQLPQSGNLQGAYMVTLMDEKPIFEAHSLFKDFQDRLKPTASRYWYSAEIRGASRQNAQRKGWNPFKKRGGADDRLNDVYVPIRWTTIIDHRLNETGYTVPMGQPNSSWYYEVPSYGSDLPDGMGGVRKANENDSRLYPYRRLIISSQNCIMYDGPAFNWHGQLDLIPFCVDKWPWEPMGFSMVHDGYQLQKSIDEIDRGTMSKIQAQMDPSMAYDINAVDPREAEEFDPFEPRVRMGFDGSETDKPFHMILPDQMYRVQPEVLGFRDKLIEELDFLCQTRDIVELGKARSLGKGMDQIEALISANGPIVKDIARGMENSLGGVGHQVGFLILQYFTTSRLMQYVGPEAVTGEGRAADDETDSSGQAIQIFDFDPNSIVPSHLPDDKPFDDNHNKLNSKYSRLQRARWFAKNIRFFLMPHSVHEITQMTYRLLLLQLKQRGLPISDYTVMSACDVPDVVAPDGNSEQQRWQSEQEDKIVQAARAKQIVDSLGLAPPDPSAGGGPPAPGRGPKKPNGRPPSAQSAPQIVSKDGGTRSTISESQ